MKRRSLIAGSAAALSTIPLARPHAQRNVTIRWWYHFDDPKATPDELVGNFERENPGMTAVGVCAASHIREGHHLKLRDAGAVHLADSWPDVEQFALQFFKG